jgi:hypothetical protein
MARLRVPLGAVIVLGVVVAVAYGARALWLYGFLAVFAVAITLWISLGGNLITDWSRRRFDAVRPPER